MLTESENSSDGWLAPETLEGKKTVKLFLAVY